MSKAPPPGGDPMMGVMTRMTGSATSVFKLKSMMSPQEFAKVRNVFVGSGFAVLGGIVIAGGAAFGLKRWRNNRQS
eukprot:CAMPEP_0167772992 /NCGR_PEP_ID=MMETSP0111_2-20121227/1165_1 /TAXON_ID=91324 /ORGANISM="Lotharella globosa, Strain CCCM811" /LENGTH=75 /DNA_ID=CAMNT_0007662565 /DNA_START=30 /DNA_END=260 /DNA_ORIENTATION=+